MAYRWAKHAIAVTEGDFPISPSSGMSISTDSSIDGYGSYNFTDGKYVGLFPASISAYTSTAVIFIISDDGKYITKYIKKGVTTSIPPRIELYIFSTGVKTACGSFIEYTSSENADAYPQNNIQDGYWYVYIGEESISAYVNINNSAKKVKSVYANINGEAKKVRDIYCNIDGLAVKST